MMKRLNKLVLGIIFLFLVISITAGCGIGKEAKIKKSFEKTLSMYPIKNLEDLYDKEGYRDDEFDKNDKSKTLSSLFNMETLKICRSIKTEIFHIIQRCRVIRLNIN